MAGIKFIKFAQLKKLLDEAEAQGQHSVQFPIEISASVWRGLVTASRLGARVRLTVDCRGETDLSEIGWVQWNNTELDFNRQVAFLWGIVFARVSDKLAAQPGGPVQPTLLAGAEVWATDSIVSPSTLVVTKVEAVYTFCRREQKVYKFPSGAATYNRAGGRWEVPARLLGKVPERQ